MGNCFERKRGFSALLPLLSTFIFSFFAQRLMAVSGLNYTYRQVSSLRLDRIQRHLEKINKPPAITIESLDGDLIDCISIRKQRALDHPLLKNHKIQRSTGMAKEDGVRGRRREGSSERCMANVALERNNMPERYCSGAAKHTARCIESQAKSLYDFGKKRPLLSLHERPDAPDVISGNGHEHAIVYTGTSQEIYGAKATINVWGPSIEESNESSLSQIWVLSGSFDGSDLNSIEAGWQVSPELYGDDRPRLFTYWTSDSYQATGCYNLLCSGFVQTNSRIAIGAAISPVSSFSSNQYDITILIWKDPKLGNWWMGFGENALVGYWPAELFSHLGEHATMVEWGGEVVNSRANGEHTSTHMGSGHFAEDGFGKASYFRNLELVDSDNSLSSVSDISTLAENTNCYNIQSSTNTQWGSHFYFGGPGRNPNCI